MLDTVAKRPGHVESSGGNEHRAHSAGAQRRQVLLLGRLKMSKKAKELKMTLVQSAVKDVIKETGMGSVIMK